MIFLPDPESATLDHIIEQAQLFPLFQPIIDFRARVFLGFEALIRGPVGNALEYPDALFEAARQHGRGVDLEFAALEAILHAHTEQRLPGRLFLNLSPSALVDPRMLGNALETLLQTLGLPTSRLVIELTENEKIADIPNIFETLITLRRRGYQIAIDDLGEGFANLRLWSDLRPEFVKIDKHFVAGIANDRIKYHFVRAMQDLAEICHAALIAEGIENEEDFLCIRDMGIACGQGYFIARPAQHPPRKPNHATYAALSKAYTVQGTSAERLPCARSLLVQVQPAQIFDNNESVLARFAADPELDVLPVVRGDHAVGMINRHNLADRFARPFQKELFGKRSCELFMDAAPLIVDQEASIQELAMMLALAPKRYLLDGFVITDHGRYLGIGNSHNLMALITEMQISAARYANPLTQLPGNVPTNEHIDRMLGGSHSFIAAYIDIDNFKPFNDTFGYRRGDDLIQILGQLIRDVAHPKNDFVGHIGGDDFLAIFQSEDWEMRCWQIISRFAENVSNLLTAENALSGGYMAENRKGEMVFYALPTLSIGAVRILPGECESHREVAAAAADAKKQAKKEQKNINQGIVGSVFIERRRPGSGMTPTGRALN